MTCISFFDYKAILRYLVKMYAFNCQWLKPGDWIVFLILESRWSWKMSQIKGILMYCEGLVPPRGMRNISMLSRQLPIANRELMIANDFKSLHFLSGLKKFIFLSEIQPRNSEGAFDFSFTVRAAHDPPFTHLPFKGDLSLMPSSTEYC